jgi:hypothetical protein
MVRMPWSKPNADSLVCEAATAELAARLARLCERCGVQATDFAPVGQSSWRMIAQSLAASLASLEALERRIASLEEKNATENS